MPARPPGLSAPARRASRPATRRNGLHRFMGPMLQSRPFSHNRFVSWRPVMTTLARAGALALTTALVLLPLSVRTNAAPARPASSPVTLIRGGTLLTVTRGTIETGDLMLRDGKIAAVGQRLDAPPGALVVDAGGRYVMPGIVDTHSHMGVYSWPEVDANS